MSFGDEQHGRGGDPNRQGDSFGGSGQTRTRLPDSRGGDVYGGARRQGRSSRSLITVVGVVVLLVAAIAFANRGGGGGSAAAGGVTKGAVADPTAPTGTKPVTGKNGTIPSGFPKNEQGAASAAANYAVTIGSDAMFNTDTRHSILDALYTPAAAAKLKTSLDTAYSPDFLQKIGLDADGNAPQGSTFVSRTIPVGTKVQNLSGDTATVSVWYTGLVGLAGPGSTSPVATTWKTVTFGLQWLGNNWKIATDTQKDGPAPVPGDVAASTADEISKAVEQYGGFTYAR
jgi:hypothetical protein